MQNNRGAKPIANTVSGTIVLTSILRERSVRIDWSSTPFTSMVCALPFGEWHNS